MLWKIFWDLEGKTIFQTPVLFGVMASLKSEIQNAFKLHGFQLRLDASRLMEQLLTPLEAEEASVWVDKVLDALGKKNLDSVVVGKDLIAAVVQVSWFNIFPNGWEGINVFCVTWQATFLRPH